MKCPVCVTVELKEMERSGIQVDYCPHCRGVWLDEGKLESLIDLALEEEEAAYGYNWQQEKIRKPQRKPYSDAAPYDHEERRKSRKRRSSIKEAYDIYD
ncbi:MAG: zf-TFIIB domain-containing protein [Anaerolineae bacterium]|nr:zf-TFIIB domain-containing protein [Anaerolineae bacterium]